MKARPRSTDTSKSSKMKGVRGTGRGRGWSQDTTTTKHSASNITVVSETTNVFATHKSKYLSQNLKT